MVVRAGECHTSFRFELVESHYAEEHSFNDVFSFRKFKKYDNLCADCFSKLDPGLNNMVILWNV